MFSPSCVRLTFVTMHRGPSASASLSRPAMKFVKMPLRTAIAPEYWSSVEVSSIQFHVNSTGTGAVQVVEPRYASVVRPCCCDVGFTIGWPLLPRRGQNSSASEPSWSVDGVGSVSVNVYPSAGTSPAFSCVMYAPVKTWEISCQTGHDVGTPPIVG